MSNDSSVDSNKRSFVKVLTYRSFIAIADVIVVFFITHRYDITL